MTPERDESGGARAGGAEYMARMREGGYGSDADPATADGGVTAGRGSGQDPTSVTHLGAHDLTRGASEMAESGGGDRNADAAGESDAERARRREADLIGE